MSDILINAEEILSATKYKSGKACLWVGGFQKAVEIPEHNDLADKSVIIERIGDAYDELYDKVDKKALSKCHVAFLKAVMYAPTVLEANNGNNN